MSIEGLQNWVIQTGLMVSFLIVIILIIRRPFARAFGANAAYALWSLPLIRLCFPVISIPENWIPQALRPANTPPQEAAIVQPVANLEFPATLPNVVGEPVAAVSSGVSFIAVGLMIWASIAVLWLCFQLLQQHQFKARLLAESQMISEELAVEAKTLAQRIGLKKTPKIRVSNDNLGPLVTGVADPIIIAGAFRREPPSGRSRGGLRCLCCKIDWRGDRSFLCANARKSREAIQWPDTKSRSIGVVID